jgi:hypothetical protein
MVAILQFTQKNRLVYLSILDFEVIVVERVEMRVSWKS